MEIDRLDGIVFDLDGTLIDSAPDLHAISARVLEELGLEPYSLSQITGFIGHGVASLVNQCLDGRGFSADAAERAKVLNRFLTLYAEAPADHARPFPGVEDTLQRLNAAGIRVGICTNKAHDIAARVVEALGFDKIVSCTIGGGRTPALKPDPASLLLCLEEMGIARENAVYVGDSETDEATAIAAGMPFILFLGGYRKKPVSAFQSAFSFDDYGRFSAWIEPSFL